MEPDSGLEPRETASTSAQSGTVCKSEGTSRSRVQVFLSCSTSWLGNPKWLEVTAFAQRRVSAVTC
jgi:hypothetical protein